MFESIGPVWDGNEVWLVVAGGATFAAFPAWYATMFSGFYLALLLVLFFLIIRVVSFEWREKSDEPALARRSGCGRTRSAASAPRSSGASRSRTSSTGVPLNSSGDFTGNFWDLFSRLHRARRDRGRCCCSRSTAPTTSRSARPATSASARRWPRGARALAAALVGAGIPGLDGGRRGRPERQGRVPRRSSRRCRDRRARPRGRVLVQAAKRLGVRADGGRQRSRSWSRRSSRASTRASWSRAPTSRTA